MMPASAKVNNDVYLASLQPKLGQIYVEQVHIRHFFSESCCILFEEIKKQFHMLANRIQYTSLMHRLASWIGKTKT